MKDPIAVRTPLTDEACRALHMGDRVAISGSVYTMRDAAHRRLFEAALRGEPLPIALAGEVIFYAAPTPAKPGRVIGSMGPTTSSRMDRYTPKFLEMGLKGMIGKGTRSCDVRQAIECHHAVYFGAIGGIAALMSRFIRQAEVVAYEDLGPEAILRLTVDAFPAVVLIDGMGRDLFAADETRCQGIS
jgi:fumarate hydratase subunit beta